MGQTSDDSRRFDRATVMLVATIEHEGTIIPVKVSNISETGCLVIGRDLPQPGTEVVFRRNDLTAASLIAWLVDDHAGLKFHASLSIGELLRHVPAARQGAGTPFRRIYPSPNNEN